MKKIAIIVVAVLFASFLVHSPSLAADKTKNNNSVRSSHNQKLLSSRKIYSFSLANFKYEKILSGIFAADNKGFKPESLSQRTKYAISQFNLIVKSDYPFSLERQLGLVLAPINRKYYSKAALEVIELDVAIWAFDKYFMNEPWAKISLKTISSNILFGFKWDYDTFITNQLGHPYHGSLFHSIARTNGIDFFGSTIYTALGSYIWEVILESIRPSTNDMIMTTFGGMTLGEALYRMADLLADESSTGLRKVLEESLIFILSPIYSVKAFTGKISNQEYPQEKHNYRLNFPIGAFNSSANKPGFVFASNLEYRDFLKDGLSGISPYDWFSFSFRFGFEDNGIRDQEIFTTGVIAGKKVKTNLAGLFGVFDYISTRVAERMSALGVGPGLVTVSAFDSKLFFTSSSVLSVVFGASSPSIDLEEYHLGKRAKNPYFLGPGMLGRVNLEFGKEGFGSIQTGFSHYWIHCMTTHANEFLNISSLSLKYDLSSKSQLSLEYDYYLRNANYQQQEFSGAKYAIRALYVLKF